MAITNESKPDTATPETYLDIGDGHNLTIGGLFKLIVGALSTSGNFQNSDKVSIGETWASNPYTWAAETRTWLAASQLIDNETKQSSSITNIAKP